MPTILYTPLDIPVNLPNSQELYDWALKNTFRENTYKQFELGRFTHSPIAACIDPVDWRDVNMLHKVENYLKNQYVNDKTVYHPEFKKLFPNIIDAIKQLPFKELTGASVKIQYGPTFAHRDDLHSIEDTDLKEPKRITMLLTEFSTLWLETDRKFYPKVTPGYPIYAFNNSDCKHGSDFVEGKIRMILDTAGILDSKNHSELIRRSIAKFPNEVIYR